MSTAERVRSVYRGLLRWGGRFPQSNFGAYTARRTRERFRRHQHESSEERVQELLREAEQQLALVRRQVQIARLYPAEPSLVDAKR
jgi:hypothetical protein